jgi:hypothetical protein
MARSRRTLPNPLGLLRRACGWVWAAGMARQASTAKAAQVAASAQNSQRKPAWASISPASMAVEKPRLAAQEIRL